MITISEVVFARMSPQFQRLVIDQAIDLWCLGMDTKDISNRIGRPEHWCHMVINDWMDEKHAERRRNKRTKDLHADPVSGPAASGSRS